MALYRVFRTGAVFESIDAIYLYIAKTLGAVQAAEALIEEFEEQLSSLAFMPKRCPLVQEKPGILWVCAKC